ncbi:MAG: peptide chain release factor N(5)-glutamine methyltransferase [Rhodospirillales bacterium]|nr:peptide chain release factor N(5)-glutamine methyltransferase [Rhodospirillales bacterium]
MNLPAINSAGEAVRLITDRFNEAGMDSARLDARVLIASALEITTTRLFSHPETPVSETQRELMGRFVERRLRHEPVARILGEREFWSLNFKIDASTLVPRPDSETLVEAVLARTVNHDANLSILDMGTGSGCLILALLSELTSATGLGIDINPQAVIKARENATALNLDQRVQFKHSDWFASLAGNDAQRFDIIVSNPPYIPEAEIAGLEPDVSAFDPMIALSGGEDGLQAYRNLLPPMAARIVDGGLVALEIGWKQAAQVTELGERFGLKLDAVVDDLAGRNRAVIFRTERPRKIS